jgi:hypothetical protein
LKGYEYTAKYNLGEEVPYVQTWCANHLRHDEKISEERRGIFSPVYEIVYNHYVNRKGIPAPYIQKVLEINRPENQSKRPSCDQLGYGPLTFSIKEISK